MRKSLLIVIFVLFTIMPFFQAFAYDPRYRFTDQERDSESGLYNFDAREYNPNIGRFIQPDPVLNNLTNPQKLKEMTGQNLDKFLRDPQNLNPYGYTRNNPIRYTDPTGEWFQEFLTGRQSWDSFQMELGETAMYVNPTMSAAIDHPYITGAAAGIVGGLAVLGISTTITWGLTNLGILTTQQTLQHGDKFIKLSGEYSERYLSKLQNQFFSFMDKGIEIGEHALNSMNKKGFTVNQVIKAYQTGQKYLDTKFNNINIIKDEIRISIDPNSNKFITNILDIAKIDPKRFILIK